MIRAVIVDDEPPARRRIRALLTDERDVEVIAECRDGREALTVIAAAQPDLVFLDVQMPGWDGFRVLEELSAPPYVVFSTAFDEYALRAFELSAVDYLLKPFDRARLSAAVGKALDAASRQDVAARLEALTRALAERDGVRLRHLGVRDGERILLVAPDDVFYFAAQAKETSLFTRDREHLVDRSLKQLEAELDPRVFFRCHRSYIVNLDRVADVVPWFGGSLVARLVDGRQVPVSRRHAGGLKARLRL